MLKVGITGGIGSGKTIICEVFKQLGIPVYYADTAAKNLYNTDEQLKIGIIELFGENLYANNTLDKKALASIIFNNKTALHKVNQLVHPAVARDFEQWALYHKSAPYVLQEAAILFESKTNRLMDKTITISVSEDIRVQRASLRDKVTPNEIKQRLQHQLTEDERNQLADFIIINDNSQPVLPQILRIHNTLKDLNINK